MKKPKMLGIVMILSVSMASGCSAAPSQNETEVPSQPLSSQNDGAENSSDEIITWDRETACAEVNTAARQFNNLFDGLILDAKNALEGDGGREGADAEGRKYAPEFERIGNKLLAANVDDIEAARAISRFGEAMLGYARALEEGFFTSETSSVNDEGMFAVVEVQGVC